MGFFDNLPTLAQVNARPRACPKAESRRQENHKDEKKDTKELEAFRAAVIKRDGCLCRCCHCVVRPMPKRMPKRLEVHHIYGRIGRFRYDPNHALVLCGTCHDRVTGAVNDRIFVLQRADLMLKVPGKPSLIDARKKLQFTKGGQL